MINAKRPAQVDKAPLPMCRVVLRPLWTLKIERLCR